MEGLLLIGLAVAALALAGYLFNNKYVLLISYSAGFISWMYVRVPAFWTQVSYPWYHKVGITVVFAVTSFVGIALAVKVVESITPNVIFGTGMGIVDARFSYGMLNLFAPLISMVVLSFIASTMYAGAIH